MRSQGSWYIGHARHMGSLWAEPYRLGQVQPLHRRERRDQNCAAMHRNAAAVWWAYVCRSCWVSSVSDCCLVQVCVFKSNTTTYSRVGVPDECDPEYLQHTPAKYPGVTARETKAELSALMDMSKC